MDDACSKRVVHRQSGSGDYGTLASDGRSAILINSSTGVLRRVDLQGERWSITTQRGRLRSIADNGDLLITDDAGALRLSQDGIVRWRHPFAGEAPLLTRMDEAAFGTYLVETLEMTSPDPHPLRQRITVLDAEGTVLAQQELADQVLVATVPSLARRRLWLAEPASQSGAPSPTGERASSVVTVTAGAGLLTIAEFQPPQIPLMELASGLIIVRDQTLDREALVDPATSEQQVVPFPDVPPTQEIVAMTPLADGALIVTRIGSLALDVVRFDADGTRLWTRRLGGEPTDAKDFGESLIVAVNAQRGCLWRTQISAPTIQCLDLDSGATLLDETPFPLHLRTAEPQLHLDAQLRMLVVGIECEPSGSDTGSLCANRRLISARLSAEAQLEQREVLADAPVAWRWTPDGELVHFESGEPRAADSLIVRDQLGEVVARYPTAADSALLAQAPGARVLSSLQLSSGAVRLTQLSPSGGWSQDVQPLPSSAHGIRSAQALPGGDWLVLGIRQLSGVEAQSYVERRSGVDGQVQWHRRFAEPLRGSLRISDSSTVLDQQAQHLWISSMPGSPSGRAMALELATGRFVQAQSLQPAEASLGDGFTSSAQIPASDGIVAAWIRQNDQSLQVKRIDSVMDTQTDQTAAAGIWNAADTPGQGFLLQTFDDGSLGGAWFTFSAEGGSDDSVMRWFALQGHPDETGSFDLTLFSASNGVFDTAPAIVTEIIGNARFTLSGCDAALLTYQFTDGEMTGEGGAIPLQRTAGAATGCGQDGDAADTDAAPLRGSYFDPQTAGQGILLEAVGDGDAGQLSGAWFTFDPEDARNDPSAQHWLTLLGPLAESGASTLTMYRTFGAALDLGSTMNTQVVGTLQVEVLPCGLSTAWQFDDTPAAGALAGASGSRTLQRIGGCGADAAASSESVGHAR